MIIQLTRAVEPLEMKSLGKARIETENICFYERVERIISLSPEGKEEVTIIVFKGGDNLCVKETPEEIDKLLNPNVYSYTAKNLAFEKEEK